MYTNVGKTNYRPRCYVSGWRTRTFTRRRCASSRPTADRRGYGNGVDDATLRRKKETKCVKTRCAAGEQSRRRPRSGLIIRYGSLNTLSITIMIIMCRSTICRWSMRRILWRDVTRPKTVTRRLAFSVPDTDLRAREYGKRAYTHLTHWPAR